MEWLRFSRSRGRIPANSFAERWSWIPDHSWTQFSLNGHRFAGGTEAGALCGQAKGRDVTAVADARPAATWGQVGCGLFLLHLTSEDSSKNCFNSRVPKTEGLALCSGPSEASSRAIARAASSAQVFGLGRWQRPPRITLGWVDDLLTSRGFLAPLRPTTATQSW